MTFTTVNGTGTGEYSLLIRTVDGIPLGQRYLTEPQKPGTYNLKWDVSAEPDPDCDPTQGPCEMWLPGNYSVEVGECKLCGSCGIIDFPLFAAICNGECGSSHPHSSVYDRATTSFNVTKS